MDDFFAPLDKYIERFQKSLPSDVTDIEILTLENFLNDLYLHMSDHNYSRDLLDAVVDALGSTSSLVDKIKKIENQVRNPAFFKEIKRLGNLLQLIRYYSK